MSGSWLNVSTSLPGIRKDLRDLINGWSHMFSLSEIGELYTCNTRTIIIIDRPFIMDSSSSLGKKMTIGEKKLKEPSIKSIRQLM